MAGRKLKMAAEVVGGVKKRLSLKKVQVSVKSREERDDNNMSCLPYCGLVNLGNTCYINVIIQSLRYCPGLIEIIKKYSVGYDNDSIASKLKELILRMESEECNINPLKVVQILQTSHFEVGIQHDSLECFSLLIDALNISGKRKRKIELDDNQPPSKLLKTTISQYFTKTNATAVYQPIKEVPLVGVVTGLFKGELLLETKCLSCESKQGHNDTFTYLSVPVTQQERAQQCGAYSLSWSLSRFASVEYLHSMNKYFCLNCRHLVEAKHSISINRLPRILVIHLKRFSTHTVSKAMGNIAIPLSLSFSQWTTPTCSNRSAIYQLYSIVVHIGTSCQSGHYIILIRKSTCDTCSSDYNWILFDDDKVSQVSTNYVISLLSPTPASNATPYIVFYSSNT